MKRFYKLFACWVSVLLLVFSSSMQSHASLESLLIRTDSNALMTMELDDSDYLAMPYSSLASVTNTVDRNYMYLWVQLIDTESVMYRWERLKLSESGRYQYYVPSGYVLDAFGILIEKGGLPVPGVYHYQLDHYSEFSLDYGGFDIMCIKNIPNAERVYTFDQLLSFTDTSSGDFYTSFVADFASLSTLEQHAYLSSSLPAGSAIGGLFNVSFIVSDDSPDFVFKGFDTSDVDYRSEVSSSLSDLSSSVDTMTDEISGVTEAIQTLQGAMEPHYSNVLTQLHHITEQLHAFYDQVYNNIHLPELDMLTQIKTAIENIDLQIEVDISEVKTAINNMSTAVQNKLQTTTDQITGGYDNSGIIQENEKLEQSINDYDEVESEIFDEAGGFVGEFEYPSIDSLSGSVIKALAFVGSFLQSIFLSMGDFSSIITFSLTMIFVMVVVGYHRIRS